MPTKAQPIPLVKKSQMLGAYMTCTGTYGNGALIGTETTKAAMSLTQKDQTQEQNECIEVVATWWKLQHVDLRFETVISLTNSTSIQGLGS